MSIIGIAMLIVAREIEERPFRLVMTIIIASIIIVGLLETPA